LKRQSPRSKGRLAQGHQFGVPERVLGGLALVVHASPGNGCCTSSTAAATGIRPFTGKRRQPQQSLHSELRIQWPI